MAPLGDRRPDPVAGLQHQRLQAPFQQMRGRGQPDRAGADHHHRQRRGAGHRFQRVDLGRLLDRRAGSAVSLGCDRRR